MGHAHPWRLFGSEIKIFMYSAPLSGAIWTVLFGITEKIQNTAVPYVWSIFDERLRDEGRDTMDQVGVVILMGNKNLLRRSVSAPHYGCYGTFNIFPV